MTKEALKLALEALTYCEALNHAVQQQKMQAITAIKEALNTASQCRATASHPLTQKMLVDGGSGLMSELLNDAADAIKALAQPVQEPVSAAEIQRLRYLVDSKNLDKLYADLHLVEEICEFYAKCNLSVEALRDWVAERMDTPPLPVQPERSWVRLTDDEAKEIQLRMVYGNHPFLKVINAIEAKLKEKNT